MEAYGGASTPAISKIISSNMMHEVAKAAEKSHAGRRGGSVI